MLFNWEYCSSRKYNYAIENAQKDASPLLAPHKHLAAVGKSGGKEIDVATLGELQTLAQLLHSIGEVTHCKVGSFKVAE